jgi:hypothetical protein
MGAMRKLVNILSTWDGHEDEARALHAETDAIAVRLSVTLHLSTCRMEYCR